MAEIKSLLKEARKFIDDNNFSKAQEICKTILRIDKHNYFALVLLGKSLQDSDQAPLAYQKAICCKSDHPLAWQGLANFYELREDVTSRNQLLSIYKKLLKLQIEEDKIIEVFTKLGQLGAVLKSSDSITTFLDYIKDNKVHKLNVAAEAELLNLLKADVPCAEQDIPLIVLFLNERNKQEPNELLQVLSGKVIILKENWVLAVEEIIGLSFFSSNVVLRELLCSYLCRKYIENGSFCKLNIETYIDKVTDGINNSKYPSLLKSIISFDKGDFLEAYKQCVPLINYQQADITEAKLILKCTVMLKKWSITEKLALNFLSNVKNEKFAYDLKKFLFMSLVRQQKWNKAMPVAREIPENYFNILEKANLVECYIECNICVDDLLECLKSTEYYEQLQALLFLKQKKYEETIILIGSSNKPLNLFYLGRAYWELQEYDNSLVSLLKAAKLDSEHADTFFYLGLIYYKKNYLDKSKKCFEKAYSLNNNDSKVVERLSEIYAKLKLVEQDFELLVTAMKSLESKEPWIHFRLGLHYLNKRDWENAINNFRNVIKNNQSDVVALECLADAYYSRGSFTSALRAYNKVISLNPSTDTYCLTKIGYIYCVLTQYEEAIVTFKKVLSIDPVSILALKGIAETWMRIAKKKLTAKLYGSARDCAQYAVDNITMVLTKEKKFTCFWKLLGDSLMFITKLPDKFAFIYTKKNFSIGTDEVVIRKDKADIFSHAIVCYSQITKQRQQLAAYDLAAAYLRFYYETKKEIYCHISFNLTVTCIKKRPAVWRNWNLLGKICLFIKRYETAQHCFIKALSVTRKWSVAKIWCNLGTLYLKLELYKLANYCFWRGQSTLPSYPQSWIGQALIAEISREEEAMDLFRHASRLGYHPESALGYADWVCRTLSNKKSNEDPEYKYAIEGLYAINYAIDLMEWLLLFEANNACAFNILGILQERSGLVRAAFKSYENALLNTDDDKKNIVLLNLGRILVRMEKYDEAIKVYKAITEASLNSTCGLALSLFKKGLYEESYSVYDTALHWLSNNDDEKADLLVAMAGIMYMFKGADDAKTILFHSIQVSQKKPTAYSLFGICSLGLIHSEPSLTKLALSELKKYEKDNNFGFDIGFLKSYVFVHDGKVDKAIKLLSDSLYDHPNDAMLWFCMAEYCLKTSSLLKVASHCAHRALCSTRSSKQSYDSAKMYATASIAEHMAGNRTKALTMAKKGLHMYPNNAEVWAALLFSIMSQKNWVNQRNWLLAATGHLRRHHNMSRQLTRWVNLLEKKLLST